MEDSMEDSIERQKVQQAQRIEERQNTGEIQTAPELYDKWLYNKGLYDNGLHENGLHEKDLCALLAEMKSYGEANHVPIINVNGLGVLTAAVRAKKPRRVLEIGTAIGYSTLYIAACAHEAVELVTLELSEERAAVAEAFIQRSRFAGRITIVTGDAGENIQKQSGPFDLVFIDAAKGQYPDYFRKAYPLLAPDGVVVADNVLFRGYVQGSVPVPRRFRTIVKRLREYIRLVTENNEFKTEIHADGDGLAVSWRYR